MSEPWQDSWLIAEPSASSGRPGRATAARGLLTGAQYWGWLVLSVTPAVTGGVGVVVGGWLATHWAGLGVLMVLGSLLAMAASGYSLTVTDWWTVRTSPPLRPFEHVLAHVAPVLGFFLGGVLVVLALLPLLVLGKLLNPIRRRR